MPDLLPPFNWRIPTGTEFFKQGFQAMRDLASDISASFEKVQGPYVQLRQFGSLGGSLPSGWSTVLFDGADKDSTPAGFNKLRTSPTAVGDSRWTCPAGKEGLYEVTGGWGPGSSVDQSVYGARILKNGAIVVGTGNLTAASGASTVTVESRRFAIDLVANDYVELQVFATNAGAFHRFTPGDGFCTTLNLQRIR